MTSLQPRHRVSLGHRVAKGYAKIMDERCGIIGAKSSFVFETRSKKNARWLFAFARGFRKGPRDKGRCSGNQERQGLRAGILRSRTRPVSAFSKINGRWKYSRFRSRSFCGQPSSRPSLLVPLGTSTSLDPGEGARPFLAAPRLTLLWYIHALLTHSYHYFHATFLILYKHFLFVTYKFLDASFRDIRL